MEEEKIKKNNEILDNIPVTEKKKKKKKKKNKKIKIKKKKINQ